MSAKRKAHAPTEGQAPLEDRPALTSVDACVRAVWRRSQGLHATIGASAFLGWAIPIFLVAIVIDRPAFLPSALRGLILVALLGVASYKAWRCGWRLLRAFNATHVALQLEREQGGLDSLLVSAVQFRGAGTASGISPALRELTCRIAEERALTVRPEDAVPFQELRRPGLIALALTGIVLVLGAVDGPFLAVGLQRIFTPWVAVEYPTDTHLDMGDGELVVRQGDEVTIEARVTGVVPRQARLSLRTGTGHALVRTLDVTDGVCAYTIASASRDFSYRIHAGDARSRWREVRVVPSPRIEKVSAVLRFPKYLQRPDEAVSSLTLTVPEGTAIEWTLGLDRPLSKASLLRDSDEPILLSVTGEGRRVALSEVATESRPYRFAWIGKAHGFSYTSPRHYLQVSPDQLPRVELTRPAENLHAILGRAVKFAVRARDDHGIAEAHISCRVNLRPEKKEPLTLPARSSGDQPLDWDYRAKVPNLKIGDTVAVAVEVRDRYAGPGGPHRARTDTRRITFLSRDEYLAQIVKRKGRLLSRIRGIYRQERAAHKLVLELDPEDDVFVQSILLEAARQEMLRDQLNEIVLATKTLIDDLAANGVSDAPEGEMLGELSTGLHNIASTHVAQAAARLREQGDTLREKSERDPVPPARIIDLASRELGRIVLRRDIDSALEVFAREARAIAQQAALFRRDVAKRDSSALMERTRSALEALAKQHEALADWTRTLLSDLEGGIRYTKRPLAVLNLTRRIKDLRRGGVGAAIDNAASLLRKGSVDEAIALQSAPIHALLGAEFRLRVGMEYRTLLVARDRLGAVLRKQNELRAASLAQAADDGKERGSALARRQSSLRAELLGILIPAIPAPRPQLFDTSPPQMPPVEALLREAQQAMRAVAARLDAGKTKDAAELQRAAAGSIDSLAKIVRDRAEESLAETAGLSKIATAVGDMTARVADFETRQIRLLEKTDVAGADGKPLAGLPALQQSVVDDMIRFKRDVRRENEVLDLPERDIAPLLGRLDRALESMRGALPALRKSQADKAIEWQEQAGDILTDVLARTESHGERLAMLQGLLALERAVRSANGYVADLAGEQRDLIAAIKAAKGNALAKLLPSQRNLGQCLVDVAPALDFVAGQLDVGTPLVFAGSDMEDALDSLDNQDHEDALDALDAASESLERVAALIHDMSRQIGYVAEIVDFLHVALSDTSFAAFQEEQLHGAVAGGRDAVPEGLVAKQHALASRTSALEQLIARAAGSDSFTAASPLMAAALEGLKRGERASSEEQMKSSRKALDENASGLFSMIKVLHGLPKLPVTESTSAELRRLLRVLALASDQRSLYRATQGADEGAIGNLAERQRTLAVRCQAFGRGETPHPKLISAQQHLAKAASLLKGSSRKQALSAQEAAGADLRHFILEQALLLDTAWVPPVSSADPDAPASEDPNAAGSDIAKSIGLVGDFVSGEVPKNRRSEWEILRQRGRAALHENFARELPLEYRGMLKSYFERVAK